VFSTSKPLFLQGFRHGYLCRFIGSLQMKKKLTEKEEMSKAWDIAWKKKHGDLAYIDPITRKKVTFTQIRKRKAIAIRRADEILSKMGLK